jgi:hypothetical protein
MKRRLAARSAKVERAFAKALDLEMFKAPTLAYRDTIVNLRRLERYYLKQVVRDKYSARELKRRIAEKALEFALFHGCKLSICRARLKALSKLGFEDVEQKAHWYLLYAKVAAARGHKRVAHAALAATAKELQRSLRRRKSLLGKQLLELAGAYLRALPQFQPNPRQ